MARRKRRDRWEEMAKHIEEAGKVFSEGDTPEEPAEKPAEEATEEATEEAPQPEQPEVPVRPHRPEDSTSRIKVVLSEEEYTELDAGGRQKLDKIVASRDDPKVPKKRTRPTTLSSRVTGMLRKSTQIFGAAEGGAAAAQPAAEAPISEPAPAEEPELDIPAEPVAETEAPAPVRMARKAFEEDAEPAPEAAPQEPAAVEAIGGDRPPQVPISIDEATAEAPKSDTSDINRQWFEELVNNLCDVYKNMKAERKANEFTELKRTLSVARGKVTRLTNMLRGTRGAKRADFTEKLQSAENEVETLERKEKDLAGLVPVLEELEQNPTRKYLALAHYITELESERTDRRTKRDLLVGGELKDRMIMAIQGVIEKLGASGVSGRYRDAAESALASMKKGDEESYVDALSEVGSIIVEQARDDVRLQEEVQKAVKLGLEAVSQHKAEKQKRRELQSQFDAYGKSAAWQLQETKSKAAELEDEVTKLTSGIEAHRNSASEARAELMTYRKEKEAEITHLRKQLDAKEGADAEAQRIAELEEAHRKEIREIEQRELKRADDRINSVNKTYDGNLKKKDDAHEKALREQKESFDAHFGEKDSRIKDLDARVESLDRSNRTALEGLEQAQADNQALADDRDAAVRQYSELESAMQAEVGRVAAQIADLERQLGDKAPEIAKVRKEKQDEIDGLKAKLSQLQTTYDNDMKLAKTGTKFMQQEIDGLKDRMSADDAGAQAKLDAKRAELAELQTRYDADKERHDGEVANLNSRLTDAQDMEDSKRREYQRNTDSRDDRIARLREDVSRLQSEIAAGNPDADKSLKDLQAQVESLTLANTELTGSRDKLQAKYDNDMQGKDAEARRLTETVEALRNEKAQVRGAAEEQRLVLERQISELEARMSAGDTGAQARLQAKLAEIERLHEDGRVVARNHNVEITKLEAERDHAVAEHGQYRQQKQAEVNGLRQEISDLEQKLTAGNADVQEQVRAKEAELAAMRERLEQETERYEADRSDLNRNITDAHRSVTEKQAEFDRYRQSTAQELEGRRADVARLQGELEAAEARKAESKDRQDALQAKIEQYERNNQGLTADLASARDQAAEGAAEREALSVQVRDAAQQLGDVKTDNDGLKDKVEALNREARGYQQKYHKSEEDLTEARKANESLSAQVRGAGEELGAAEARTAAVQEEHADYMRNANAQAESRTAEVADLAERLDRAKARADEGDRAKQAEIERLKEINSQLNAANLREMDRYTKLNDEYTDKQIEAIELKNKLSADLEAATAERDRIAQEKESLSANYVEARQANEGIRAENERLDQDLGQTAARLADARTENASLSQGVQNRDASISQYQEALGQANQTIQNQNEQLAQYDKEAQEYKRLQGLEQEYSNWLMTFYRELRGKEQDIKYEKEEADRLTIRIGQLEEDRKILQHQASTPVEGVDEVPLFAQSIEAGRQQEFNEKIQHIEGLLDGARSMVAGHQDRHEELVKQYDRRDREAERINALGCEVVRQLQRYAA